MKHILSTTAVLVALSGGAYAESHMGGQMGAVTYEQGDFMASDLIGMRIYNAENEMENGAMVADGAETEWDDIGEINDIIVGANGEVRAVILGIGGFLGLGERDVSISMDDIRIVQEEGDVGDRFLVVNTSKEALEAAPEFERDMDATMADADMATDNAADTTVIATENAGDNAEMAAENAAEETEMAAENAAEETEMAVENAAEETEEAAENAEAEIEGAADQMEAEVEENDADNVAVVTNTDEMRTDGDLERPAMAYDGYEEADMDMVQQLTSEEINGSYVYGANDETVGEIDNLLMSEDGMVERAVINVGGFLGLGEKPVAVNFDKIQVLKNVEGDDYRFYIDSTEERLEALPEYND